MVVTIALMTLGGIASVSLPCATYQVNMERLKANPIARCVWARDRSDKRRFDDDELRKLEDRLRGGLGGPERIKGCHPFTKIKFEWCVADGSRFDEYDGRTLTPGDLVFRTEKQRRLFKSGGPFVSSDQQGIIVTPSLLEHLGFKKDDVKAGATLKIRLPYSEKAVPISIIGVTRDPLPLQDFYFVINDKEFERLLNLDPDSSTDVIETGLLGPGWPEDPENLGPKVKKMLIELDWEAFGKTRDGGKPFYRFQLLGQKEKMTRRSVWKDRLKLLHNAIVLDGLPQHDVFVDFHVRGAEFKEPPPPRKPPEWVGVYVEDLEDLEPTVEILRKDAWLTNQTGIIQVNEIRRSFFMNLTVLWWLAGLFCIAALVGFGAVHCLRAGQKAAQIGMMRAMGMSDGLLLWIVFVEAFILWLVGTFVGLVFAPVVVILLGYRTLDLESEELAIIFFDPSSMMAVAVFLCVSFVLTIIVAWLSTIRSRKRSPVDSLALTS
jgi:hypothetical protein